MILAVIVALPSIHGKSILVNKIQLLIPWTTLSVTVLPLPTPDTARMSNGG